jgi:hypothetical protein
MNACYILAGMSFHPTSKLAETLEANRQGRLTGSQRMMVMIGALFTAGGLTCMGVMFIQLVAAVIAGIMPQNILMWLFLIITFAAFIYLALTLYVNARTFIPDLIGSTKVKSSQGKLEIRLPKRERWELPFSYIVGDYSFAPFEVPDDVPMEKGREYVVYYLAHTRKFLSIEPAPKRD